MTERPAPEAAPRGLPRDAARARRPEIALPEGAWVIADLHLDPADEHGAAALFAFLERIEGAPLLLVLGDLFDAWVGDAHLAFPGARRVARALARLEAAGTGVEIVHGNRDFLLGEGFARASGARVRPFGLVGRLEAGAKRGPDGFGGERPAEAERARRVLFVHGDELSTLDRPYQRLRRVLRSPPVLALAPRVPRRLALSLARRLRGASRAAVAAKPSATTALQADAARFLAEREGCATLVCGHAHRFREERLAGDVRWLVLDAFGAARDALVVQAGALVPTISRPPAESGATEP